MLAGGDVRSDDVETIEPDSTLPGMSTSQHRYLLAAASVVALLVLSACAAAPGSAAPTNSPASGQSLEDARPAPPPGPVSGTGTVIDAGGDVQLCLGAIMESYPPQCLGIPIDDWSWDGVEGSETSGDVTWGAYAIRGTYDGKRFTNTDPPIPLALFDPPAAEDPTDGRDGSTDEAELTRIQDEVAAALGPDALSVWTERGYVWLGVVWDDGTIQDAADAEYGEGVVIVTPALRTTE